MPEAPSPTQARVPVARTGTTVVLVAPEALGATRDPVGFRGVLTRIPSSARVLLRVADAADLPLADAAAEAGLPFELLLGIGVPSPAHPMPFARMPPAEAKARYYDQLRPAAMAA